MRWYEIDNIPIDVLPTPWLQRCLRQGLRVEDADGMSDQAAVQAGMEQIQIELLIRKMRLRG